MGEYRTIILIMIIMLMLNGCHSQAIPMEIIVEMPSYEGLYFKVFKYDKGSFDGDFVNQGSLKP